ncbi:amidohydrolase family protein [Candidatus Woesearchaeota archaeon]|nr:amidohydrolase family protein [Candidatus Woesearchaeota archaeon]
MVIDVHTHIFNEKIYRDYLRKSGSKVSKMLVLHWYKSDFSQVSKFCETKKNLFLIGNVDFDKGTNNQLKHLERLLKKNKIFGIKLYPGYQYFYPSDKKVYPVAKLCQKYGKPLIFHSGDVYNPEGGALLKYSHPIHIDALAVKFPKCKMIISHFGFPYLMETANIVSKNGNVYTDISGTIMQCGSDKELKRLLSQYEADLGRVFSYFPNIKHKIMFGTDYGGEHTPLNLVQPYIWLVKKVFSKKEQKSVFYKTANKLFFAKK